MRVLLCIGLACLLAAGSPAIAQKPAAKEILYAGTFSEGGSQGIYVFQFDRKLGKLTQLQTVTDGTDPNFLALSPGGKCLYAVYSEGMHPQGKDGVVMAYKIDRATGKLSKLNERSTGGEGPAHVSTDPLGRFVYVSNYSGGSLAVYPLNKDGSLKEASDLIKHQGSGPRPEQKTSHVHCVIPSADGKYIYASDLGTDKIMIYRVSSSGKLSPAAVPYQSSTPGSGPRHFALSPDGRYAFSAEEFTSTVTSFSVNRSTGALSVLERVEELPADIKRRNSDTDIHVSADGLFLYVSNSRPHYGLAVFAINQANGKLTPVANEDTYGLFPRNFCIDKKGEFIFAANRDTHNITVLKRNEASGRLTFTGQEAKVPVVVCIQQLFMQ